MARHQIFFEPDLDSKEYRNGYLDAQMGRFSRAKRHVGTAREDYLAGFRAWKEDAQNCPFQTEKSLRELTYDF